MARYDGMDELLERVRVQVADQRIPEPATSGVRVEIPGVQYETALGQMLGLLHEAEQLHRVLKAPEYVEMPMGQVQDLVSVLDKVQRELRRCEAMLQR